MKSCLTKALVVFLAASAVVAVAYFWYQKSNPLPVYSPAQVNPILVDEDVRFNKNHRVEYFSLSDQTGGTTDSTFLTGKIHVADFFFTTCQTICPIMSGKMDYVASQFSTEDDLRFLSFSVLPEEDSIPALAAYATAYGVDDGQWRLLTGDRKKIYQLARRSYFTLKPAEVGEGDGGKSDFIHTNNFVLVDSQQRIRGYYDGTSDLEMNRLISDIELLLEEEKKKQAED
ncbi:MAG: SCO family protein [Flavobacteriales bacterium]|nr:SCO family protein [Flavobacteriales bacterium]